MPENYDIEGHVSRLRHIAHSYENSEASGDDIDNYTTGNNDNNKDNNECIAKDEKGVPLWSQQRQWKRSNRDSVLSARKITQDELFEEIRYLSFFYMGGTPWSNESAHELAKFVLDEKILPIAATATATATASAVLEDDFELEQYLLDSVHRAFQELPSVSKDKASNIKSNTITAASNNRLGSGLKPQLGYSSTAYEGRNFWKDSDANFGKLQSVSTLYFWLQRFVAREDEAEPVDGAQDKGVKKLRRYWHVIIPAILKVLDDTDGMIKVLGCRLLRQVLARLPNGNSNSTTSDANSTNDNGNYLAKSGLDQVFADSITVCFAYVPSVAGSIAKSRVILNVAYETMLQLIIKCSSTKPTTVEIATKSAVATAKASARVKINRSSGLNDMDNQLIDLLNLHILDRVPLVLSMSSLTSETQSQGRDKSGMMSDRIEICNIYATMVRKVIKLLSGNDNATNTYTNGNKAVLVLRLTLWKFILPVLTDSFLLVGVGNDDDDSNNSLLAFLENLLRCALELIEAAAPRVQKYQFDILAGLIIFIERFEKEICHNDAIQDLGIEFAAAGISAKISEIKSNGTQEKRQSNPVDNDDRSYEVKERRIDKVKRLLREVVLSVLAKGSGVEAIEVIDKKPFMREYVEQGVHLSC